MAVSVMLMMRTASRWNLSLLTRVKYRSRVIVKVTLENMAMDMRNRRSFSRQRNIDSWRSFGQEKSSQGLPAPEGQERVPVLSRSNQVSSDQFFFQLTNHCNSLQYLGSFFFLLLGLSNHYKGGPLTNVLPHVVDDVGSNHRIPDHYWWTLRPAWRNLLDDEGEKVNRAVLYRVSQDVHL